MDQDASSVVPGTEDWQEVQWRSRPVNVVVGDDDTDDDGDWTTTTTTASSTSPSPIPLAPNSPPHSEPIPCPHHPLALPRPRSQDFPWLKAQRTHPGKRMAQECGVLDSRPHIFMERGLPGRFRGLEVC